MQTLQLSEDKREAYTGLQGRFQEQRTKMTMLNAQYGIAKREETRNKLTLTELDALPAGTNTYVAVGKMFIQEPCEKIIEELTTSTKETVSELEQLAEQRTQLQASMTETEKSLKEILSTATVVSPEDAANADE